MNKLLYAWVKQNKEGLYHNLVKLRQKYIKKKICKKKTWNRRNREKTGFFRPNLTTVKKFKFFHDFADFMFFFFWQIVDF